MEGKKASSSSCYSSYASGVHPGYFNVFAESFENSKKDKNKNNVDVTVVTIDEPLRAPICCMLGAVDSGKTSLLDCMRGHGKVIHPPLDFTRTNAATFLIWRPEYPKIKLSGLLFIDTPGLKLFTHSRFIQIVTQFKQHGIETEMYYGNKLIGETVSIVPTCAISGEGLTNIKNELIKWTQNTMLDKLTYTKEELQCTVLDVKLVQGRGTTINVVLVNGTLHVGDQIAVCGTQGQIVTSIQALWTAPRHKELDAEAHYICHNEIKGVKAVKIIAQGLEHAIPGTDLQYLSGEA